MKRIFATFAALAMVSPAFGASFIINGTGGTTVQIGTFGPNIEFTSTLLSGLPTNFGVDVHGMIGADPRWCAGLPPGEEPPDCDAAIDPFAWSGTFTASLPWPESQDMLLPLAFPAEDGFVHFGPTDGGRVRIDVDGTAVPEPAIWAMMLGGFGLVGGAMRSRKRTSAVSFG